MNPQALLEQFLGTNTLGNLGGQPKTGAAPATTGARETSRSPAGGGFGFPGGAIGGLAAGGLLGALLGQKKVRKMAGGVIGYGGAAALGAVAFRAYQNWQAGQQAGQGPAVSAADVPQEGSRFAPVTAADGKPFALALLRAMIAAANADGHIGADEQKQIFEAANRGGLDAEDKAFLFDALQIRSRRIRSRRWPEPRSRQPNSISPRASRSTSTTRTRRRFCGIGAVPAASRRSGPSSRRPSPLGRSRPGVGEGAIIPSGRKMRKIAPELVVAGSTEIHFSTRGR